MGRLGTMCLVIFGCVILNNKGESREVYAAIRWVLEAAIFPEKTTWVFYVQSGEKWKILNYFSGLFRF